MGSFLKDNPELLVALVLYALANLAPRPHPKNVTGWTSAIWWLIDRLAILSAEAVPGKFKWLFASSVHKPKKKKVQSEAEATDPEATPDTPKDKPLP